MLRQILQSSDIQSWQVTGLALFLIFKKQENQLLAKIEQTNSHAEMPLASRNTFPVKKNTKDLNEQRNQSCLQLS